MAISSKDADDIRCLLKCPICLERQNTPRLLPCIHSFCQGCLQTFIDKRGGNGKFLCPRCKLEIRIPKDGSAGFPFNHFIENLNDCVPKTTNVFCYVCHLKESAVEAESMCIQCAHHLCKTCAGAHCLTGMTFTHKVVSLDEVAAGKHFEAIREHQRVCCPQHPDKVLELYCERCKIPVCLLCKALYHNDHEMGSIEEASKKAIEELTGLMELWIDAVGHAEALSNERKNIREELNQGLLAQKLEELGKIFDDFKKRVDDALETGRSKAITKLNEQFHLAQKQTQAAYEEAEHSRLSLKSTLRYAKKLVERAHPAETTQQKADMAATLASLDISQLQRNVDRPVLSFLPSELPVPKVSVDTGSTVESKPIDTKVAQLHLPFKFPVHHDTPQPAVKESKVVVHRFSSLCERQRESACWGLAVCDGRFVVADWQNKHVKGFSGERKLTFQRDHHKLLSQRPADVACAETGEIFVSDWGINGIVRYNGDGRLIDVYSGVFKDWGFLTCHNDRLFVSDTDGGRVIISDFECNTIEVLNGNDLGLGMFRPRYVCVDNSDHLIVSECDPGRVHVIDYKRRVVLTTLTDQLGARPHGVCVDQHGHILVADYINDRVILYDNSCAHVIVPRGNVVGPTGLCLPAPGQVSVVEYLTGVVKTFQYLED